MLSSCLYVNIYYFLQEAIKIIKKRLLSAESQVQIFLLPLIKIIL